MTLVIPVVKRGNWVVYEDDIESEGKLAALQSYVKPLTNEGWNVVRLLLDHVGEVIESGTNVYQTNVTGLDREERLIFVQHEFRTAGMTITWRMIEADIDRYLEEALCTT